MYAAATLGALGGDELAWYGGAEVLMGDNGREGNGLCW